MLWAVTAGRDQANECATTVQLDSGGCECCGDIAAPSQARDQRLLLLRRKNGSLLKGTMQGADRIPACRRATSSEDLFA